MKKRAVVSYVGYAIKSRNILYGVDNIVGKKVCGVVLYDRALGKSSLDKLKTFLAKKGVKGFCVDVEDYYPGKNCKAIGITDKNLASAIIKEMEESDKNE